MKTKFSRYLIFGALFALLLSLVMAVPSKAQVSGVSLDFAAAEPTTYNHITGGGKWNGGTINVDIERSLEGEDFACFDKVSYLTRIDIPNTPQLIAMGAMTFQLKYSFDLDTTGAESTAGLIALANSKLATLNRAQLIQLGGYFDFWNNAVHASLP